MNPLLFADWRRMNRLFTKLMWIVAAIMVCVVFVVLASSGHSAAAHTPHRPGLAAGAAPRAAAGAGHSSASSR